MMNYTKRQVIVTLTLKSEEGGDFSTLESDYQSSKMRN